MTVNNRFQAFGLHLAGSVLVALLCASLVFGVWYAWPLGNAAGVNRIFLMLLGVDVVLGPLLTLLVFNRAKKELKRDLLVVLIVQLAALGYGMHSVFVARPVYMVYVVDRFDLAYANELTADKLAKASAPAFRSLPIGRPLTITALRPTDRETRQKLMFDPLTGGDDLHQLPQFYAPYDAARTQVKSRLQPLSALAEFNPDDRAAVDALVARYSGHPGGVGFVPVRGKVDDLVAVVARDSADVLELVTLKPWP